MKIFPFLLICLFITSCKSTRTLSLTDILKSDCCWDITDEKGVYGGKNSCYRFLSNGDCFFYYYNFYNKQITDSVYRYDDDDVIVPDKWSTKGDSILIARGTEYRVISRNTEHVAIIGYRDDTLILKKNCSTKWMK